MTDQEMEERIQEISAEIADFSKSETPLTKAQRNHKQVLLLEKETLKQIKTAKEKGNWQQEIRYRIDYSLLTTYGEKHPFLMYLIKSQSSWNLF